MAIFNLNFLLKVGQVEMCQNPSPISTQHNKTKYGGPAHTTQTSCVLFPMIPNWLQLYFGGWGGDFLLATQ